MRRILLASVVSVIPALPHAEQIPSPHSKDSRMCDVPYDPDNVVKVIATVGDNVTVVFGKDEVIDPSGLALSDASTDHISRTMPDASNVLYFKAKMPMPAQPIAVRTTKSTDSSHRIYQIEWSAIEPTPPDPVAIAAVGNQPVIEPAKKKQTCYTIRYLYPADVKAETDAKARVAWRQRRDEQAEIALRNASIIARNNLRYVGQGDVSLAPTEVWDNAGRDNAGGQSQPRTEMHFAGRVPAILKPSGDDPKQDAQLANVTIEDNGVVKIIGIYPMIRLRDGERVLCIINKSVPTPTNVTTGTVSPEVSTAPRASK